MTTANRADVVIGLEVHAQLLTQSKMFCGCSARYWDAAPNAHVCPVDLGLPGALPVINQKAIDYALMVALALHCSVPTSTKFDRKNYHYPDLPKGYQISQYDMPIGVAGYLDYQCGDKRLQTRITRVHLEEDTGKSLHDFVEGHGASLIDYNRSGVPLMEIVSEPDILSPEAARHYFAALRQVLVYLGVSNGNMQEGALRADINVSIRQPDGSLGVKTEIKNLNSFRSVHRALQYEIERQRSILQAGGTLTQDTRGWDEARQITVPQRSKEYADDYRYFPEPDLPQLHLSREHVVQLQSQLPELADARRDRFMRDYGLAPHDASVLTGERGLADLFERTAHLAPAIEPKVVSNWLLGEFLRLLNETGAEVDGTRVTPDYLAELLDLLSSGAITTAIAKAVFEEVFATGRRPQEIVLEHGLTQIADRDTLISLVDQALMDNPKAAAQYPKTEGPLVGMVMRATNGKANAEIVKQILRERLSG